MTLPTLIYGTAWKKDRTTDCVLKAWQAGFRCFDTACQPKHYREDLVGAALRQLQDQGVARSDYYLQTKFTPVSGQDPANTPYDAQAPLTDQVEQSLAASLQNLGTSQLDALILHSPLSPFEHTLDVWRVFESFVAAGSVRRIGISNCYQPQIFDALLSAATIKPSILQNRFYAATGYDKALRRRCREEGIRYQSFWTLTANPQLLEHPKVFAIARRMGVTPAQILFRYLTLRDISPLTGTTNETHMREDLEIFSLALTADDLATIDAILGLGAR